MVWMKRQEFITRDGITLVYNTNKEGCFNEQLPLVLVGGLSSVKEDWTSIISLLSEVNKNTITIMNDKPFIFE